MRRFYSRSAGALLVLGLLCVNLALVSCGESKESPSTPVASGPPSTTFPMPPPSGKSLGNLGWQLADGQRNTVAQYKGNVLVLDFYATWCEPCRRSIPALTDLQKRYRDRGLRVVGLNVGGPDDWSKVEDFARELRIDYTLAVPEDELSDFLLGDNRDIPQTFIFDRQGVLVKRLIGFSDRKELDAAVESVVAAR